MRPRGFTVHKVFSYHINSAMFRSSHNEASFQSIVGATNESKLLEREEFGDMRDIRICTFDQCFGASTEGR